ncbi:signal peptidase II [Paenibacillus sepulcri]|uniref:Lipoprotein signal peptidase n=1 Tax=Paenibacillus sepulcri TaxID=359917 RepID=A0ABS7C4G1_9BACL|nr:signal peptidase II [Paenibacillus sepulcri]
MLFYIITVVVILIDQISKGLIRMSMEVGETISIWPGVLRFIHYENTGAAMSSFQGFGRYFVIVAVVLAAAVLYYRRQGELRGVMLELITGLMVGGALGNAIDRAVFGKVTDFISLGKGGGSMNVADIAITISFFLILARLALHKRISSHSRRV